MKHLKCIKKKRKGDENKTTQFFFYASCPYRKLWLCLSTTFFVCLSNFSLLPFFPLDHSSTQASQIGDRCYSLSFLPSIYPLSLTLTTSPNTPSPLRPRNSRCFFLILYTCPFYVNFL